MLYLKYSGTICCAFWGGKSLAMIIGAKSNTLEAFGVTVILISLMSITAKLWG